MDNNEIYNYSVIMGIRNAISHGKVKCKGIASEDLKDIEIEFIDYFDDKIQFKLNIKVYNLFSLIEKENLSYTNMHLKKKLNKKD